MVKYSWLIKRPTHLLAVLLLATFMTVVAIAQSNTASIVLEAENGTFSAGVTIAISNDSSGGQSILFNAENPPPTGNFNFAEYPNLTNTGIAGVGLSRAQLATHSGNYTTSRDGEVIEMINITNGIVYINHDNVTLKRSYIAYSWPGKELASKGYTIEVNSGTTGLVIEDTTVEGGKISICCGNYTLRRVNVFNYHEDGLRLSTNSNSYDSYIHSPTPNSASEAPHNDGMQSIGGLNANIVHNTIEGPLTQTAAIIAHAHLAGDLVNYTIEDNLLSGGGYTLNLDERNESIFVNVRVLNNIMLKCSAYYGPFDFDSNNFTNTNQSYETGEFISEVGTYKGIGAGTPTCARRMLLHDHRPDLFYDPPNAVYN